MVTRLVSNDKHMEDMATLRWEAIIVFHCTWFTLLTTQIYQSDTVVAFLHDFIPPLSVISGVCNNLFVSLERRYQVRSTQCRDKAKVAVRGCHLKIGFSSTMIMFESHQYHEKLRTLYPMISTVTADVLPFSCSWRCFSMSALAPKYMRWNLCRHVVR